MKGSELVTRSEANPEINEDQYPQDRRPENQALEQRFIQGNSLDSARLMTELKVDGRFNLLLTQLRQETSPVAGEKRMEYELQLYSQPLAQNGSVSLDQFECGARLCASELRAPDQATLDQFLTTLTSSEGFEPRAVVMLLAKPKPATPHSETRRIIFSHDTAVTGVAVSPDALKSQN